MKQITLKKLSMALIIIALIFVTACSSSKKAAETDSPNSSAVPEQSAAPTAEPTAEPTPVVIDPLAKYDPPIEITTVRSKGPDMKFADGDTIDNNPWYRAFESELGIKVKNAWSVDSTQFAEKMNVTIASNDIPDFMMVDPKQFQQLIDDNMIEDLTKVYAEYASPRLKEVIEEDGGALLNSGISKGIQLGIPFTVTNEDPAPVIWLRKDWLTKLNLPEPKTMQDVLSISTAFKTKDPNGNGKPDEVGLGVTTPNLPISTSYVLNGFFNSYHAYLDQWMKDGSGNYVYSNIQPEMKQALLQLQALYKSGEIDPEYATKTDAKLVEDMANGNVGLVYSVYWITLLMQQAWEKDTKADWIAYPIVSNDSNPALPQINSGAPNYYVVKKGYGHPEALIKLLNLWAEKFDPKTVDKALTDVFPQSPVRVDPLFANLKGFQRVRDALNTGDKSKLGPTDTYEQVTKFESGDKTQWSLERIFGRTGSVGVLEQYVNAKTFHRNDFNKAPTTTMVAKGATLTDLWNATFDKIVMGKAGIEEFDKYILDWKKLGGDDITKEVNDLLK